MRERERRTAVAVLDFWRSVELFHPPPLPVPGPGTLLVSDDRTPPWLAGPCDEVFTVFLGVFPVRAIFDALESMLPSGRPHYGAPPTGLTALGCVRLDREGRPVPGSAIAGGGAWAVGRARVLVPGDPGWLAGFDPAACAGAVIADTPPEIATVTRLRAWRDGLARALRVPDELAGSEIWVVSRHGPDWPADPLNGAVWADLAGIAQAAARGDCGTAFAALMPSADVVGPAPTQAIPADTLFADGAPDTYPPGCWPGGAEHPPTARLQRVVNLFAAATESVRTATIPPATGRHRLLRDLLAAEVTRRADALADAPLAGGPAVVVIAPDRETARRDGAALNAGLTVPVAATAGEPARRQPPGGRHHGADLTDSVAEAVAALRVAQRRERDLRAERRQAWASVERVAAARAAMSTAAERLAAAEAEVAQLRADLHSGSRTMTAIGDTLDDLQRRRSDHQRGHRRALAGIAGRGRRRARWQADLAALEDEIARRQSDLDHAGFQAEITGTQLGQAEAHRDRLRASWQDARVRASEEVAAQQEWSARWGTAMVDDAWWRLPARRERRALWSDPEWAGARAEVFGAAVDVCWAIGQEPPVPVVTPEEFAVRFGALGREAVGVVIVVDAERLRPAQVVGPAWRAERVVLLGDSLRHPAPALPGGVGALARDTHRAPRHWDPEVVTAQMLGDAGAPERAAAAGAGHRAEIAMPLRVTNGLGRRVRRVLNEVGYGGLLIRSGGHNRFALGDLTPAPPSCWLDVAGTAVGQWVPEQGTVLTALLDRLAGHRLARTDIAVITPFGDVAAAVSGLRATAGIACGTADGPRRLSADVGIVVLGGAAEEPGALAWACSTPQLACTLLAAGRRRLYVIGEREIWHRYPYFGELAAALDVVDGVDAMRWDRSP